MHFDLRKYLSKWFGRWWWKRSVIWDDDKWTYKRDEQIDFVLSKNKNKHVVFRGHYWQVIWGHVGSKWYCGDSQSKSRAHDKNKNRIKSWQNCWFSQRRVQLHRTGNNWEFKKNGIMQFQIDKIRQSNKKVLLNHSLKIVTRLHIDHKGWGQ